MKKVLVTGGGAPGAPGILNSIKKALPAIKLFSCDFNQHTAVKRRADSYFTVPMGTDENYINELLKQLETNEIDTVLPITTKEIVPLSIHKPEFEKLGINVIVSNYSSLQIANDKGKLYKHLDSEGIAVPQFNIAQNYDEYVEAKKQFKETDSTFIVKPCVANGSRGFRIVSDSIDESNLLFNHKPNSTYISEEKLDTILQSPFPPLLVSEHLPGDEYTVDCLVDNGVPKLIVPRKREKMNNGISVAGTIEHNKEIIDYSRNILETMELHGPIGIQVKYSKSGTPLIVEINPRIQGTTVACTGAGVNIPAISVSDFSSIDFSSLKIAWGTKFVRHYEELYF